KSVKSGEQRTIPLHPDITAFYDWAMQGRKKDDFIFNQFTGNEFNGRASYLISNFPKFLRNVCSIKEEGKKLSLHSLRHRFIRAMTMAGVPEMARKEIVGHHTGVHGLYNSGQIK